MMVRKTLEQAKAESGRFDRAMLESFTDGDIERMIDEDPDLASRTETLPPFLEVCNARKKLGLMPVQFAGSPACPS